MADSDSSTSATTIEDKLKGLQGQLCQLRKEKASKQRELERVSSKCFRLEAILTVLGKSVFPEVDFEDNNDTGNGTPKLEQDKNDRTGTTDDDAGFFFEKLPNEMRVPILEYLVEPQDKLNMIEAVSSSEQLMGWNWDQLHFAAQFQMIYPFIEEYLDWMDVFSLCLASPCLERSILKYFGRSLNNVMESQLYGWNGVIYPLENCKWKMSSGSLFNDHLPLIQNWCGPDTLVLPFEVDINLHASRGTFNVEPFLNGFGGKLWCVKFSLDLSFPDEGVGIMDLLAECLHHTPNLRCLELKEIRRTHRYNEEPENPVMCYNNKLVPPELPQLTCINLFGDCTNIQKWILSRYTHQLESLHLFHCYLSDDYGPTCFPKLEQLSVNIFFEIEGVDPRIETVQSNIIPKFCGSPLKAIYLQLQEADLGKFPNFLLSLNAFGTTLEILEMRFKWCSDSRESDDFSWILRLNLSKLKSFHLGEMFAGSYNFLLGLPSLNKLSIGRSSQYPFPKQDIMKFSSDKEKMMTESSVWKLLPQLQLFQMEFVDHCPKFYVRGTRHFKISRAENLHNINYKTNVSD